MEEDKQLQDEFSLGDVDKNLSSKQFLNKKNMIIFGSICLFLILIIIILIIIITRSEDVKDDAEIYTEIIGEINCIFEIEKTKTPTQLISEKYEKNSGLSILIEGQRIKYSKQYQFEKTGLFNVQIVLYQPINMDRMFENIEALKSVSLVSNKKTEITSMKSTFEGCKNLYSFNITGFDTSPIKSISKIFYNCESLIDINIDQFDTSNVEDMSHAFSNTDIEKFNFEKIKVNKLKNASFMFYGCNNLIEMNLPISLNSEQLEDISHMFAYCTALNDLDLNNLNTQNVKNMSGLFRDCISLFNLKIDKLRTDSVTDMSYMFEDCTSLDKLDLQ
jgi:surface protein